LGTFGVVLPKVTFPVSLKQFLVLGMGDIIKKAPHCESLDKTPELTLVTLACFRKQN
jgi:hypothetical protein